MTPLNYLFAVVGFFVLGVGYLISRRAAQRELEEEKGQSEIAPTEISQIELGFGESLAEFADAAATVNQDLTGLINEVRTKIYQELGVMLPFVGLTNSDSVESDAYYVALREVPVAQGLLEQSRVLVKANENELTQLGIKELSMVDLPETQSKGAWVSDAHENMLRAAGLPFAKGIEVIASHLSIVMRRNAFEFIGVEETKGFVDFVKKESPSLVEQTVPSIIDLPKLTDVFRQLVREGISIKDTRSILEIIAREGGEDRSVESFVDLIRVGMKRQITYSLSKGAEKLFVILLDDDLEALIEDSASSVEDGKAVLSLPPSITAEIFASLQNLIENSDESARVIVTDKKIRRVVSELLRNEFQGLRVVSFGELTSETNVQPIGKISIKAFKRQTPSLRDEITELPGPSVPLES